jgi:hypothetical protein
MKREHSALLSAAVFVILLLHAGALHAEEVWTGDSLTFTKENWADWTGAENQDVISPSIQITRGDGRGLINAAVDLLFTGTEPTGTEWAVGDISDYATLSYSTWLEHFPGPGPLSAVGVPVVLHLIAEDIYIPLTVTWWQRGSEPASGEPLGGGFTYVRGTRPETPITQTSWSVVKSLYF